MTHTQLIKEYGTPTRAASELNVTLQTLRNWKKKGIPHRWQGFIHWHSGGKLKADRK